MNQLTPGAPQLAPDRQWRRFGARAAAGLMAACFGAAPAADITFHPGLTSGMVVQRDRPVSLGGMAAPRSSLTVQFGSQEQAVRAGNDGHWSVALPAMAAGGPHSLVVSDGTSRASLDDVWVGDVWLASGQSNMQMGVAESIGGRETLAALSRRPAVRFLEVPRGGADAPASELKASWMRATPESLERFSAVACHFAEHLLQEPSLADIPLGLINSSFGGTSIEAWSPASSLADIARDQLSGSMFGIPPGALYNAMIHPLTSHPIKGVLWYQGEANAGKPGVYAGLLRNMMRQWREAWRQDDLPFLVVQLPAFDGTMGGLDFGWLREAQDNACTADTRAWSVPTYDTTDGFDLHPKEKQEIGRRLALIARRHVYGQDIPAHGPRLVSAETAGTTLAVTFDQDVATTQGKPPLGFAIAGEDGDYRFAKGTLQGRVVTLEAEGVPHPKSARYAWGGLTPANLVGAGGLPAFPFRTDEATPQSVQFQPMPTFQRIETPVYELETGRNGRIASLIIRGQQFLSHEPPGGTAVPGGFGFRNLALTTVLGPRRLTLADGGVTLEVACQENTLSWTLVNHGNDPADIHINLAADVAARAQDTRATLTKKDIRVEIEGITRLEGNRIIAQAPPHASRTLHIVIEPPGSPPPK